MKQRALSIYLIGTFLFSIGLKAQEVTQWVNPFIGTGAVASSLSGNNYPGATVPFGMVQLSPDTRLAPNWGQASGYDYNDKIIVGFSHTRLSGTGVADLIDILLMPTVGEIYTIAKENSESVNGYQSHFSHDQEKASPGYYQVFLKDYGVNAELTATTRVGIHRYTYPKVNHSHLVLDLDHSAQKGDWDRRIIQSQIRVVDEYTVEGYRIITGWAKLRKVYFQIKFSKPIISTLLISGDKQHYDGKVVNGTNLRAVFDFDTSDKEKLITKVALSPVSIKNAGLNMDEEAPGWNFDEFVDKAKIKWDSELSKIKVKGTTLQKEIFYTALYHTMVQPNTISDVNGEFMASDYSTQRISENETEYSTFSLWDTFRAVHPLYTLLQPKRSADFVNSMLRQYKYYGYLPIWQLWGQENYCMIGNHSIPVIVDAILKGIPGIDINKAYEAVLNSSIISHPNSPFDVWEKYGYMPENIQTQSVSITLEQSFDDWCVAQLAKKMGKIDDYQRFIKRSEFYKNLFNPITTFFQPKDDKANWIEPFDPYRYGANGGYPFTEGNAWQYYWSVLHQIPSLVKLTGGNKAFSQKLTQFFTSTHQRGDVNGNASGFIGQYAHGNEPSQHVAYLYDYVGESWKTQRYVTMIADSLYNNTSAGYAGNDDCGQMSAWYVFSAMGFYPVNPASGVYAVGTPLLDECIISLPTGKTFTIRALNRAKKNIYIQSALLNGKPFHDNFITHQNILNGGILEFKMGEKPRSKY